MRITRSLPPDMRLNLYHRAKALYNQGWGHKKIAKYLGISRGATQGWLLNNRYPLSSHNKPNLNLKNEISYIIGVMLGDGYFYSHSGKWELILKAKDRDFVEYFNKICSNIVGVKLYAIQNVDEFYCRVSVHSRILFEHLKQDFEKLKQIIDEFPSQFLRGFFDSEGGLRKRRSRGYEYTHIFVCNTNVPLLLYVKELLKNKYQIDSYLENSRTCKILCIGNRKSILFFAEHIGFTINRKQERLNQLTENILRNLNGHQNSN